MGVSIFSMADLNSDPLTAWRMASRKIFIVAGGVALGAKNPDQM